MRKTYISKIHYEIGHLTNLDEIVDESKHPDALEKLRGLGYRTCSVYSGNTENLATAPIRNLLEKFPEYTDSVDAIVVAQRQGIGNVLPYLGSLGFKALPVIELGGMECGNLVAAIMYADVLVKAGVYKNVICCFVCEADEAGRILSGVGVYNILGDGSVCCIVSETPGEFEIVNGSQTTALTVYSGEQLASGQGNAMVDRVKWLNVQREQISAILDKDETIDSFDHMASLNLPTLVNGIGRMSKYRCGTLFDDNVPRYGHIASADVLINLDDMYRMGKRGDILLNGFGWQSMCLLHLKTELASTDSGGLLERCGVRRKDG